MHTFSILSNTALGLDYDDWALCMIGAEVAYTPQKHPVNMQMQNACHIIKAFGI